MKQAKKDRLGFTKGNYILLLIGVIVITIGYIVMGQNDIILSPLLLFVAYIIIIPVALLVKFKKKA